MPSSSAEGVCHLTTALQKCKKPYIGQPCSCTGSANVVFAHSHSNRLRTVL